MQERYRLAPAGRPHNPRLKVNWGLDTEVTLTTIYHRHLR